MAGKLIGFGERVDERFVLVAGERGVEVVIAVALAIARERVKRAVVERVGGDDRGDRVVERQRVGPEPGGDGLRERVAGKGTGRHDAGRWEFERFAALDVNAGMRLKFFADQLREELAVHGQRGAARHPGCIGARQEDAPEPAKLGLEQAVSVGGVDRFEGVAADQLADPVGAMRRSPHDRTHLDQRNLHPPLGQRPGCLAAGQPAADYRSGGAHVRAASSGSVTSSRCPHLRQVRVLPSVLLVFSSIPTQPQEGHSSGTGLFQVEKSHCG